MYKDGVETLMLLSLLRDLPRLQIHEWRSLRSSHPQLLSDGNFLVWSQPRVVPSMVSDSQCSKVVGAGFSHQALGLVWSSTLIYQHISASPSMRIPISVLLGSARKLWTLPWFPWTHLSAFCSAWRHSRKKSLLGSLNKCQEIRQI